MHESTGEIIVLRDGTEMVVVWHGAAIHPESGVKGGLTVYPYNETPTDDTSETLDDGPILGHVRRRRGKHLMVRCRREGCERVMTRPQWLARRHPYCSSRCARLARHAARRAR